MSFWLWAPLLFCTAFGRMVDPLRPNSSLHGAFVKHPLPAYTTGQARRRGNASYVVPRAGHRKPHGGGSSIREARRHEPDDEGLGPLTSELRLSQCPPRPPTWLEDTTSEILASPQK
eukprot:EG_transcript_40572